MNTMPAEIWIGRGNDQLGPHSLDKIGLLHAGGTLQVDDLLWWDGLAEWTERDAALNLLGIETVMPRTATADPPPMPHARVAPKSVPTLPSQAPVTPERARALKFMFAGMVVFAVLAAAGFAFLRTPKLNLPSLGGGRADVAEALSAAALYKTAYAEHVMTLGQAAQSIDELGLENAPYGALEGVWIESGTLLLDTRRGILALQPFQNANGQIWFRCAFAAPPTGMQPLGTRDSAEATTVTAADLPDSCR